MYTHRAFFFTVLLVCSVAADCNPNGMRVSKNEHLPQYAYRYPDWNGPCPWRTWGPLNVEPQMYCNDCRPTNLDCWVPEFDLNDLADQLKTDCNEPCCKSNVVNIIQASNCRKHRHVPACRKYGCTYRPYETRYRPFQYYQRPWNCPCRVPAVPQECCSYSNYFNQRPSVRFVPQCQKQQNFRTCGPTVYTDPSPTHQTYPSSHEQYTNVGPTKLGPLSFSNATASTNTATNVYLNCEGGRHSDKAGVNLQKDGKHNESDKH